MFGWLDGASRSLPGLVQSSVQNEYSEYLRAFPDSQDESRVQFFEWTLTHPMAGFTQVEPVFSTKAAMLQYLAARSCENPHSVLLKLAMSKIEFEWARWEKVHEGHDLELWKLDNRLMSLLHRFVLDRDGGACVICRSTINLEVHHIFPRRRGSATLPRHGRSVPTNLLTLCRDCHAGVHSVVDFPLVEGTSRESI